jgi:hypothetical protein
MTEAMNTLRNGSDDYNLHYGAVQALAWALGKITTSPSDVCQIIRICTTGRAIDARAIPDDTVHDVTRELRKRSS